jgi:hypothetical protein
MFRRLAVVLVVAAACTSSSTTTTTPTTSPPTTASPTTASPDTSTTDTTGPEGTTVDPGLAAALRDEIAELARITEDIRGLDFLDEPNVVILSEAELAERVREDFLSELEPGEVEWTAAWMDLMGLLDADQQSLLDIYLDLIGEQVIGLYVPDTRELLVRGDAEELSPLSRATVVHELIHALTDQHFDIDARLDALDEEERYDEVSAYLSLLEGEATYFQFVYITEHLSSAEALALATEALEAESPALDATPYSISEPLFFRYEAGFDFTLVLADDGIGAINDALREPPLSTEQIAHPERFETAEAPLAVSLPPLEIPGYEVVEESTWGELGLLATFGQVIGPGAADQIGDGWGGDGYRIMTSGDEVLFAFVYRGDTDRDATEVADAFVDLAGEVMDAGEGEAADDGSVTFSGEDFAFIDRAGDTVVFVAASDPATGEAAAATLALGQA